MSTKFSYEGATVPPAPLLRRLCEKRKFFYKCDTEAKIAGIYRHTKGTNDISRLIKAYLILLQTKDNFSLILMYLYYTFQN